LVPEEELAVENVQVPDLPGQPEAASIVDVREVPLDQLSTDDDAKSLVDRVLTSTQEPSLLVVASFNSAI
jgi:hypothetical protein